MTSELRRSSQDSQKGGEGAKDRKDQTCPSGRWGNRAKHNLELLEFKYMDLGDHACNLEEKAVRDVPGILVAKTLLPTLGASFPSLVWELDSTCHN